MRLAPLLTTLLMASAAAAQGPQPLNMLEFKTDDPAAYERVRHNTASRPLTLEALKKLQAGGIGEPTLLDMVATRRVLVRADADVLLDLKKAGASDDLIGAVSQHAWPPNDGIEFTIQIDVTSPGGMGRPPYLYLEIWHEGLKRQEAMLFADLRALLAGGDGVKVQLDRSDPTLPQRVGSVSVTGLVRSRNAGKMTVRALITQQPGLRGLKDAPTRWANQIKTWTLDYPAVSLESRCRVRLGLERDVTLKDLFVIKRDDFECRWE